MALFNQFSGTTMHNAYIILAFNITMTGLQPLIHAIFEKVCVCGCVGVWMCVQDCDETSYIFGPTFPPITNVVRVHI